MNVVEQERRNAPVSVGLKQAADDFSFDVILWLMFRVVLDANIEDVRFLCHS
jgi:hypothetical protein